MESDREHAQIGKLLVTEADKLRHLNLMKSRAFEANKD